MILIYYIFYKISINYKNFDVVTIDDYKQNLTKYSFFFNPFHNLFFL